MIYVDMDGVVSDFDAGIADLYMKPMEKMSKLEQQEFWNHTCIETNFFAHLPPIVEGLDLVRFLIESRIDFAFLTSTGGGPRHFDIAKQKMEFLARNFISEVAIAFCTGTKSKASFAAPSALLIDDRLKVVDAFRAAGGCAFLFSRDMWLESLAEVKQFCGLGVS